MSLWDELRAPFPPEKIHWRVGNTNKKSVERQTGDRNARPTKGQLLAYLNARDVMDRLDEVVGPDGWEDVYHETPKRLICTLRIKVDGSWVEKSDGAGDTNMEGEKGGLSDAFKRAAVKFGVGRYLYDTESPWVDLDQYGNMPKNFDGSKYLRAPSNELTPIGYMNLVLKHWDTINEAKGCLANDEIENAVSVFNELPPEVKHGLWRSYTKGGVWTVEEYNKFKGRKSKGTN